MSDAKTKQSGDALWEKLSKIFEKHTVALTKYTQVSADLKDLYTITDADTVVVNTFEAKKDLIEWCESEIRRAEERTAKAYGGCTNCYGKGYATVIEYASGYDTDQDIGSPGGKVHFQQDPIKPCSCDRGEQLARLHTLDQENGGKS